jgi:hypothetical protein
LAAREKPMPRVIPLPEIVGQVTDELWKPINSAEIIKMVAWVVAEGINDLSLFAKPVF